MGCFPRTSHFSTEEMRSWLPVRDSKSHKNANGRLLAYVGSHRYPGAAILSLDAAVQVGAGIVCALMTSELRSMVMPRVPEVIPMDLSMEFLDSNKHDALLVGCGIGLDKDAAEIFQNLLSLKLPTVIDGDGITFLSQLSRAKQQEFLHEGCLITPNKGELARLLGVELQEGAEAVERAIEYATKLRVNLLLKDFPGIFVAHNGGIYGCQNECVAASTAGCGDVLAGVCAGFMAQGLSAEKSALLASRAVDNACCLVQKRSSLPSVRAQDLIRELRI